MKYQRLALALVASISLAACGSDNDNDQQDDGDTDVRTDDDVGGDAGDLDAGDGDSSGPGDQDAGDTVNPPGNPTVEATIGATGGTLTMNDGFTLTVPAGAVAADTVFSVTVVSSPPALADGLTRVGRVYELEPSGVTFAVPVTVTMPVPTVDAATEGTLLGLRRSDGDTYWSALDSAEPDATTVSVRTSHFSLFSIARVLLVLSQCADLSTCSLACDNSTCEGSCNILGTGQPGGLSCRQAPQQQNPTGLLIDCTCTGPGSDGRPSLRLDGLMAAMRPEVAMHALATQCGWPCTPVTPTPPQTQCNSVYVVGAAEDSSQVRVLSRTGTQLRALSAYETSFQGGVYVAAGDLTSDGIADYVVGPRGEGGPEVAVFDGRTGEVVTRFLALTPQFTGGVSVAAGDFDEDGVADIVAGAGVGGGPLVQVFNGVDNEPMFGFLAFDPAFEGGVTVATGNFDGDAIADIVVGTRTDSSQVRVFSGADGEEIVSFFAFDPTYRGGVNVAAADVNNDGIDEIIVGAASGAPRVNVIDGATNNVLASFFAGEVTAGGVFVAAADMTGDGRADLVTGFTGSSVTRLYDGETLRQFYSGEGIAGTSGATVAAISCQAPLQPANWLNDGPTPTPIWTATGLGLHVATDAAIRNGVIYWTTYDPGHVHSINTDGTGYNQIVTGGPNFFATSVATSDSDLVWTIANLTTSQTDVGRMPYTTSVVAPAYWDDVGLAGNVAVDGDNVCWIQGDQGIVSSTFTAPQSTSLHAVSGIQAFVADGVNRYYGREAAAGGTPWRLSVFNGTTTNEILTTDDIPASHEVGVQAVDDSYVYFVHSDVSTGFQTVARKLKNGTGPVQEVLDVPDDYRAQSMTITPTYVYIAGYATNANGGWVVRVDRGSPQGPTLVASVNTGWLVSEGEAVFSATSSAVYPIVVP